MVCDLQSSMILNFVDEENHAVKAVMMEKMAQGTNLAKEFKNNIKRCLESEEKSKMDEIRCMMLEIEVENLKKRNKELEEQITRVQSMSDEEKGKETVVDLTGEENERDELRQLIIDNKILECEKVKAETELHFWKEKVKQLVSQVCELESKLNTKCVNENCSKVKRRLPFEEHVCSKKKFAPSTPGFTPPFSSSNVIDLSDEDVDHNEIPKVKNLDSILKNIDEDDMDCSKLQISAKRKRSSNVVTSDGESSDDDNAPICTLIKKDVTFGLNKSGISSSEDENLGGFIVKSSENGDSFNECEDGLNEVKVTSNKIRRKNDLNLKWDIEGDMLVDFGKDPELCMRAVCALYRQQTSDERACKGFSHIDALRVSKVGEFLTDGDSNGDLSKTVEELGRYDTKGVELCMVLAVKYSKQLFEIYQKKEDPYFLP